MASYRETKYGWRAEVFRRGIRRSESGFRTKAAAVAWASAQEAEILAGAHGEIPNLTVKALLERYEKAVSEKKKGRRWEKIRLQALGRDPLAQVRLRRLATPHVAEWQERRLCAISEASVRRERNLLNNVFNVAVNEWHWLKSNPFKGVRRPKDGEARERIATQEELKLLEEGATDKMRRVIIFAVETGARAGEIVTAQVVGGMAHVDGKTGRRKIPLTARALEAWQDGGFGFTAGSISTLFARLCDDLKIEGLTFHDLRATAATRLSKKLNALQLAKMFGWKDVNQAMTYYRETVEDIGKLL